jgi:hypothetical protein
MVESSGGTISYKAVFLSLVDPDSDPDPPDQHVLGLPDPAPYPLDRGMDPDPSIIKQK